DLASTFIRLPPPALISRTPSRTSCHTSRSASNLASALPVSFLLISKHLQQLPENVRGNVLALCLCIQVQHPTLIGLIPNKINNSEPAPLSRSRPRPAYLAHAPGLRNHLSGFRVLFRYCCSSEYSSSSKYAERTRSKMDDSMNVNTWRIYAFGVCPAISEGFNLDAQ